VNRQTSAGGGAVRAANGASHIALENLFIARHEKGCRGRQFKHPPVVSGNVHVKLHLRCLEAGIERKDDAKKARHMVSGVRRDGRFQTMLLLKRE
jgi:hypothetical protein